MLKQAMIIINSLAFAIVFTACNSEQTDNYPPAPLNNKQALEKLSKAYETVAEGIPTNPIQLKPSARKKFVDQVFSIAGYSYVQTLEELSKIPPGSITHFHEDMKQLLLLPHYRVNLNEFKDIYSEQEFQAILTIEKNFSSR